MIDVKSTTPLLRPGLSRTAIGRICVSLCFAALLALGITIHRDHGFAYDEESQRVTGAVAANHILARLAPWLAPSGADDLVALHEYEDRDYGVAFEAPAVLLEGLLGLADTRDVYLFRHLLTFLVCLCGTGAVYCLAHRRFADWRMGLLAVAFLVLTPRLFAESFYNTKDAVFMAAVAIALNTAIAFVLHPRATTALLHGLATAFAIDIRIAGIVLPAVTVAIVAARMLRQDVPARRALPCLALYLAATALFVVAGWPWLWSDPLANFAQSLASMSRFVRWDDEVLFMGALVRSIALPWYYAPVWISITTPPLHLVLFAVGAAAILWRFAGSGLRLWKNDGELQDLVFLGLFVAPIAAVIVLHSVMYNGWRQLYFVYPAFLLVALRGWQALWSGLPAGPVGRPVLAAVTVMSLVVTAAWMWRAHPLQNVYFNVLAGTDVRMSYELDYWGLSTRRALEHVLAHDPGERIDVREANSTPLEPSFMILKPQERRRLRVTVDESLPHYAFVNGNRFEPDIRARLPAERYDLFQEIKVDDEVIVSIFKRKLPPAGP